MSYCNIRTVIRFFTVLSTLFLLSTPLYAHSDGHGHHKKHAENTPIHVENPRVNPIFAGMPVTAVYADLYNHSDKDLTLVAVSGDISPRIEIHEHTMDNGLMKMQEVANGVVLPAGKTTAFAPGGYHIMIMEMNRDIKEGDTVKLTLQFDDGSTQMITAIAKKPSMDHSSNPAHHGQHHQAEKHKHQ